MKKPQGYRWILLATILAVLLRVGLLVVVFVHPDRTIETDSGSYIQPAQMLIDTGYYSFPSGMRMPMYPAFIAVVHVLFGDNLLAVIVVQVLLGLATIYLTYRTGILLGLTQAASALGAVILSLSLESLISPYFVLSDTWFTFLLVAATYTLMRFIRTEKPVWLVSTSLLTGFVTLCRPIAMAFGLVSLVILLLFNKGAAFLKRIGHAAIYIVLIVALFIAPWTYRNAQVVGVKTITTESDLYWVWSAAMINADLRGISVDEAKVEMDATISQVLEERGLESTEANLYAVRNEVCKKIIFANLGRFLYLTVRYDLRSFLPGMGYAVKFLGLSQGSTEGIKVLQSQGIIGVINNYFGGQALSSLIFVPFVILLVATYIGAITGVVDFFKKRDWLALAVLLLPAGYLLGITGYSANSRYRVPVMPFFALLAGAGLILFWNFLKPKLAKRSGRAK
jgi:4-amino-4-deoxy-L-arabinose transferase-like glycosyltransferase